MGQKNINFIDSFRFSSSSLDRLVENLNKNDFKYLSQEFDSNILDLVMQKGFYRYEYMSDFETFEEELPIKENFYSLLIGKKVGDYEYEHVLKIQDKFQMKTMKDCHNFHLKCDALLLADDFEKFRNKGLVKNYLLFLSHYLKAPALSSQTMLNITKVEIEFIQDRDMQFFFEKSMRGRVSYIYKRYSKANNKYLKSYDPKYVIYLYANNLYGYAMSKFLPISGFKQIDPKVFE